MADFNLITAEALDLGDLYSDENALRILMNAVGVDLHERNRIITEGFTSMDEIVTHHSNDTQGFETYLITMNKNFSNHGDAEL